MFNSGSKRLTICPQQEIIMNTYTQLQASTGPQSLFHGLYTAHSSTALQYNTDA